MHHVFRNYYHKGMGDKASNLHAPHDERHLMFKCPAMQCVRGRYPALFSRAINTMQLFMWQHNIVGVAHYIKDCSKVLVPLMMFLMMHQL